MKSVLISIQPKWCELIASGKKTVEVRKTRPKLETPFKCYIYETKEYDTLFGKGKPKKLWVSGGGVIGEFVCDDVIVDEKGENSDILRFYGNLTHEELLSYGKNKTLYGWHISDLVIYDKPRELSEFQRYPKTEHCGWGECDICRHGDFDQIDEEWFCRNIITRPPQSWCYVEGAE